MEVFKAKLEDTEIYRAGRTASYLNSETKDCSLAVSDLLQALDIRFDMKSKGGGVTSVLVRIGLEDLSVLEKGIETLRGIELKALRLKAARLQRRVAELEAAK